MTDQRVCPTCSKELFARNENIVDHPDGAVEFDCRECGVRISDNSTRTLPTLAPPTAPLPPDEAPPA